MDLAIRMSPLFMGNLCFNVVAAIQNETHSNTDVPLARYELWFV